MISGSEDEAIIIQNEAAQWKMNRLISLSVWQMSRWMRERESGETLKDNR